MALSEEDKLEIREIFLLETRAFYEELFHALKYSGRDDSEEFAKLLSRPVGEALERRSRNIKATKRQLEKGD